MSKHGILYTGQYIHNTVPYSLESPLRLLMMCAAMTELFQNLIHDTYCDLMIHPKKRPHQAQLA